MRQQLECEVARPGYKATAVEGLALGVSVCVCAFVNVRVTSPVSLRPEDATAIYTVCVIHLAKKGGGGSELFAREGLAKPEKGHRLVLAVKTC